MQLNWNVTEILKYGYYDRVTVQRGALNGGKRYEALVGMSTSVTDVWLLPLVDSMVFLDDKRSSLMNVTDAIGSRSCIHVKQDLDDSHLDLLWVPTEMYKTYDKIK